MLEVFADNRFMIEVLAQNTKFYLVESGVYRIDVGLGGDIVWRTFLAW